MPLESGNRPADLNEIWPLDIDPAALGGAHIRKLKLALRANLLGAFVSIEAFKTFYATDPSLQNGCLAHIDGRWFAVESVPIGLPQVDGPDWFFLAAGVRASAVSSPTQAGQLNSQNTDGMAVINSSARRRPLVRYVPVLSGTEFDVVEANAAFPNNQPISNDVCIQLIPGSNTRSLIRYFNGSSWVDLDFKLFSRAASFGFFAAQMLSAMSLDTDRVRTRTHEIVGETNMQVFNPDGFGPDDLVMWFGPKDGLISFSGEISYSSLTKNNALRYDTLAGISGGGGEADPEAPVPPTDATILANVGSLGTTYSSTSETYSTSPGTSSVGITMNTNGTFTITGFDAIDGLPLSGAFLSDTTPGIGDQFEVRFESVGSVLGTLDSWLPLSIVRGVYILVNRDVAGVTTSNASVTVRVRKTSTPGVVESKTVSLSSTITVSDGIIP